MQATPRDELSAMPAVQPSAARAARFAFICGGLLAAASVAGCTNTVTFEGKTAIAIVGDAPPRIINIVPTNRVKINGNSLELSEKIQFELNKATILPESYSLLDEVAATINAHPEFKRISIEGHASSDGVPQSNLVLSDQRAKAVMDYLTQRAGVEMPRLSAQGFGDTRPIADNNTEEGRIKNRRVEFNIVERDATQNPPVSR